MAKGVEIRFDGVRYGFWQTAEVSASVDDLCESVQLGITSENGRLLQITANTVIEVLFDNMLVSTVRVDSLSRSVDAQAHDIAIAARSLARELVDCQYSKTLSGLKLDEILKTLCKLFAVPLKVVGTTFIVPDFSMQCEEPANALINAARAANKLLYATADGGVVLTDPSDAEPVATLIYGQHFTSYRLIDEFKLRFSEYAVKATDHAVNEAIKGHVTDSGIQFFRPLHLIADRHGGGLGACERRALLERNRRIARAHRIELEIVGWSHPRGIWAVNTQVRVVIPLEGIDAVFLIAERSLSLNENGHTTRLQVMHRSAFLGEAVAPVKGAKV